MCVIASPTVALTVTLDQGSLLELNHYSSNLLTARVLDQSPGLSGGVQFNIHFPGAGPLDTQLFYTTMQDVDLSDFESVALTFSVLSLDGIEPGSTFDLGLYASPFVRDAVGLQHFWELTYLDLTAGPGTITQDIPVSALAVGDSKAGDHIQEIGFEVRIDSDLSHSDGFIMSLLVTPTPGAIAIPEPTIFVFLIAGTCLLPVRKRHS